MAFVGITTLTASIMNIWNLYWPQMLVKSTFVMGFINTAMSLIIIICVGLILGNAVPKWFGKGIRA
jgi:hypothetical protein